MALVSKLLIIVGLLLLFSWPDNHGAPRWDPIGLRPGDIVATRGDHLMSRLLSTMHGTEITHLLIINKIVDGVPHVIHCTKNNILFRKYSSDEIEFPITAPEIHHRWANKVYILRRSLAAPPWAPIMCTAGMKYRLLAHTPRGRHHNCISYIIRALSLNGLEVPPHVYNSMNIRKVLTWLIDQGHYGWPHLYYQHTASLSVQYFRNFFYVE